MKVNCDFLPQEYKSFVLNVKALGFLVVFALASSAIAYLNHSDYADKLKGHEGQIRQAEEEIAILQNKIASKTFNQGEIRELIDKFNFIREAVGARDFPYLRFYHSLEKAIPVGEVDGSRRVAIKNLSEGRGNKYKMQGLARHWEDLLRFERNLNTSTFHDPVTNSDHKNFTGVTMGGWTRDESGNLSFVCEFTFTP